MNCRRREPFVSVVVPVFNEEKYLAVCIESILSQTFKNFECIIVNNCSTDNSLTIAKQYEKEDERIKVIDNALFLNQLRNHNEALKHISPSSNYCKMVLGDDFIFPHCLEEMVEIAESDPNIGIVSSYRMVGNDVGHIGLMYGQNVYEGRDICRMHFLNQNIYLFGSQSSVMYNSDIVRKRVPFFCEESLFADGDVCFELLDRYKFGFVHQILTFTRTENKSTKYYLNEYVPVALSKLVWLKKYGGTYLNAEEYSVCLKRVTKMYYWYLGKKIFSRKNSDFWQFHRRELKKIGLKFDAVKTAWQSMWYLVDKLFNPKKTFIDIYKRQRLP